MGFYHCQTLNPLLQNCHLCCHLTCPFFIIIIVAIIIIITGDNVLINIVIFKLSIDGRCIRTR